MRAAAAVSSTTTRKLKRVDAPLARLLARPRQCIVMSPDAPAESLKLMSASLSQLAWPSSLVWSHKPKPMVRPLTAPALSAQSRVPSPVTSRVSLKVLAVP